MGYLDQSSILLSRIADPGSGAGASNAGALVLGAYFHWGGVLLDAHRCARINSKLNRTTCLIQ